MGETLLTKMLPLDAVTAPFIQIKMNAVIVVVLSWWKILMARLPAKACIVLCLMEPPTTEFLFTNKSVVISKCGSRVMDGQLGVIILEIHMEYQAQ